MIFIINKKKKYIQYICFVSIVVNRSFNGFFDIFVGKMKVFDISIIVKKLWKLYFYEFLMKINLY